MSDHALKSNQIVVSDTDGGRQIERVLIGDGYLHVLRAADDGALIALCTHMRVDLLVADLAAPSPDGAIELLDRLAPAIRAGLVVLGVAGQGAADVRRHALVAGVRDTISSPVDATECRTRVRAALLTLMLETELAAHKAQLAATGETRVRELAQARQDVLLRLAVAAEFHETAGTEHPQRVGRAAAAIAHDFGLTPDAVALIAAGAPLHDIGKIGIPDHILHKRAPHSEAESEVMRTHAEIGAAILGDSAAPEVRTARTIALCHHERWDGSGYPQRLSGVSIPIEARIVAIADHFDALASPRPHREAWSLRAAVGEIQSHRGRRFDPALTDVFMSLDHEYLRSPLERHGTTAPGPSELSHTSSAHHSPPCRAGVPTPSIGVLAPYLVDLVERREHSVE